MLRGIAKFIMRGQSAAIVIAGVFAGLSLVMLPFSILAAAAVALYSLRKGDVPGIVVLLGTVAIVAVSQGFLESRPGLEFPVVYALLPAVWICARILRQSESQELALLAAGGFAALLAAGMHVMVGDVVGWWESWVKHAVTGVKGATFRGFERDGTLDYANGIVAVLYGLSVMVSVLIARWWQALLYNPGGFRSEFHNLRLPKLVLAVIAVLILLTGLLNPGLATDLAMVAVMVYFIQGLAVLHGLVGARSHSQLWLLPPYFFLIILPQYVIVGMALAGALDAVLNFRSMGR